MDSGASAVPNQGKWIHYLLLVSSLKARLPAKRQRVGDFVKTTLDIAKESADIGYPLKAALTGMSALVEHYEVLVRQTAVTHN